MHGQIDSESRIPISKELGDLESIIEYTLKRTYSNERLNGFESIRLINNK